MFYLTPEKINLYFECKRCFYLDAHKFIFRPACISVEDTISDSFNVLIKRRYGACDEGGVLPVELNAKLSGKLFIVQMPLSNLWEFGENKMQIRLMPPEQVVLMEPNGARSLLYFRLKSPLAAVQETEKRYWFKMAYYAYVLETLGYRISGKAHLVSYCISDILTHWNSAQAALETTVQTWNIKTDTIRLLLAEISYVLYGKEPEPTRECPYCRYLQEGILALSKTDNQSKAIITGV